MTPARERSDLPEESTETADWLAQLQRPETYGADPATEVTLHETHISWVLLCGDNAYKLKKPVANDFLDYSTLSKREACCHEEIRLNQRYIDGLYLNVVAVTKERNALRINGDGPVLDYAVRMKRFSGDALLLRHLHEAAVSGGEIRQLAATVAQFHENAERLESGGTFGTPTVVLHDAMANFTALSEAPLEDLQESLADLSQWTRDFHERYYDLFSRRLADGFVRECHGDLHTANVIAWQGHFVPFDGIEFNPALRWIDVLADAAFLGMDLVAQDRLRISASPETAPLPAPQRGLSPLARRSGGEGKKLEGAGKALSRTFLSSYLEQTGDYESLQLYRFYAVYRALVRAKVAAIRAGQAGLNDAQRQAALIDCREHIKLTSEWTTPVQPSLWITHGVSGSGKSTGSEAIVQQQGTIRIRSDVERKRLMRFKERGDRGAFPDGSPYSEEATHCTYQRLASLARQLLKSGYPVVVDATFLKRSQRDVFASLAESTGAAFQILRFQADDAVLRQRLRQRAARQDEISDADSDVLDQQTRTMEPLTTAEQRRMIEVDPLLQAAL